jgi:hypothetical protein
MDDRTSPGPSPADDLMQAWLKMAAEVWPALSKLWLAFGP